MRIRSSAPAGTGTGYTPATTPAPNGIQYLGFYSGGATPAATLGPPRIDTKADIGKGWDDIINTIGQKGDGVHQQLGFFVGPIGWDLTDAQLKQMIDDAFALAEAKNVAVGFHIEDSMFWYNRTSLWSNNNNVEWSNWQGTIVPHRIIGWVGGGQPILAPPMCFNSPTITTEATRLARDVIGAQIKQNVDRLNAEGKGYLFMGVIAGWETRMQDDSQNPHVDYGYCALHNLGYSASNPPADLHKALQGVVSNWVILWTKGLSDAGIPRGKIYTHTGALGESSCDASNGFCQDAPPSVVFNSYSYPGFSVYGTQNFSSLYTLLGANSTTPWGVSEGTGTMLSSAYSTGGASNAASASMEQYLASVFNHHGTYVDLFGWSKTSNDAFAKSTTGPSAILAYQKFLKGQALQESVAQAVSTTPSTPCPSALPSGAPIGLSSMCTQLKSAEQAGTIKYPFGPIQSVGMLNASVSDQISAGNYANAEAIIQLALSSK